MTNPLLGRILVPLDGSSQAEAILSHLRRIVPRHESKLTLFQSIPIATQAREDEAEVYLRKTSSELTNEGYPSEQLVRVGSVAETILETAAKEHASLIALSTHGRTGPERWVLGSVAEKVLEASPVPVLVTRSVSTPRPRGEREALPIRNFLVPLDGSRLSLDSLGPVLSLARPVDAHVTLLHVDEPSPYSGRWESPDETLKEAEHLLRNACIPATVEIRRGEAALEILKAADEKASDLIAMTTHGRSGPSRWLFGSVTAEVLRSASVPLLVVRHSASMSEPPPKTLSVSAD
ncbi:MAG TPA: universal stress protein [Planctomycetota bacterium]|nr:universal stress protein [Planctomycetota bacterium]